MKCPTCQFEYTPHAKFCSECRQPLCAAAVTPFQAFSLGEQLEKIQRYLPTGLTDKILSQKDRIEGEQRQVTVMFCDMAGYLPIVERLGSEWSYHLMDEIYEILIHKVHEFEGTVNDMTGDGVMALFGAPIAMEDAPQRALSSGCIHNWLKLKSFYLIRNFQKSIHKKGIKASALIPCSNLCCLLKMAKNKSGA